MRRFSVSAVLAAILLVLSAVAAAQGSGGGQGIAVQFQVVATLPATCPTAGIVFEVPTAGTYAYYNCPTAGSAPVSFGSGGGGGGVSSVQVDSNTALTGAVKLVSGNALSSSQAGQTATFNVANATTGSVGVLALAQDLAGTSSAPKVIGFDGVALKDGVPANGQAWIYNSTDAKYELGTPGGSGSNLVYAQTSVQSGDSVTASSTNFATAYTFSAGSFCSSVGQAYTIIDSGTYIPTASGTPQLSMTVGGQSVFSNIGLFVAATSGTELWQINTQIVCLATGASASIEAQSTVFIGGSGSLDNPLNGAPSTAPISLNASGTVVIQAGTGVGAFTGTFQQRELIIRQ